MHSKKSTSQYISSNPFSPRSRDFKTKCTSNYFSERDHSHKSKGPKSKCLKKIDIRKAMPPGSISEKVRYQMLKDTMKLFEGVSKNRGYQNSPDLVADYNDQDPQHQEIIQKLRNSLQEKLSLTNKKDSQIFDFNSYQKLPSLYKTNEDQDDEQYNFSRKSVYSGMVSKKTEKLIMPGKAAYNDPIQQKYLRKKSVEDFRAKLNQTTQGVRKLIMGYNGVTDEMMEGKRSTSQMKQQQRKMNKTEMLKSQISPNYKEVDYFQGILNINVQQETEKLEFSSDIASMYKHDQNIKKLEILSSLSQFEKKKNLPIQKIKQLRREALNQSYNSKNSIMQQFSSRIMVNDLNALMSPKKTSKLPPGLQVQKQIQIIVQNQNKEKRINKLSKLIEKNKVPSPEKYINYRQQSNRSHISKNSSQKSESKVKFENQVINQTFDTRDSFMVITENNKEITKKPQAEKFMDKIEIFEDKLKNQLDQNDVLDPDISDEERQLRYIEFKKYHMKRLNTYIKKYKKEHRISHPDEYDSDDSLTSLYEPNEPRRMFGRLAKDKATGKSYKIPSVQQIRKILMDNMKTTAQIVDILIPGDISLKDQLCAIAIMQNHKLMTDRMMQEIKKREDKLSQYINFITGQNVFSQGHGALSSDKMFTHGLSRHLSKSFQNYVDFCDNSASRVANALVSKLKYFKKCKSSMNPKTREELQSDPHFNYFSECQHEMELALPILEKVFNKTLSLYDYTLSPVHTQALEYASKFFENFVNRILLDNCGVSDDQFSRFVQALSSLQDFKSITYRRNEFGLLSANAILVLTDRRPPYQLEELRIQNCRIASSTTIHLLQGLLKKSHLSKLSLVEANLNAHGMSLLCEFIKTNRYIDHIDISWNNIAPQIFTEFLEIVKSNRKIKFLNLSWNQLLQIKKITQWDLRKNPKLILDQPPKPRLTEDDLRDLSEDSRNRALDEEERSLASESEIFVSECLCSFIKYNPHLHHLDLQGTGLTHYILLQIARALRKSRSLVGIHLSENPGLSLEIKEYIIRRVHCKDSDFKHLRVVDLSQFENLLKKQNLKINHKMFQDSIRLGEIIARKRCDQSKSIIGVQKAERTCILTRFNGHKHEMHGNPGQWQMLMNEHENCWICDKWTYSLVFFNPAKIQTSNPWDQCDEMKQYLIKQLMLYNGDTSIQSSIESSLGTIDDDEKVQIFASFTNWKPRKMIPFLKFISTIDKDKPDFLAELLQYGKIRESVKTEQDLNPDEYELYQAKVHEYNISLKNEKWEKVLQQNLKYKKPAILNLMPNELQKPERLYVLPIFIKSGKHNMMIKYRDNDLETLDWIFERGIVDFRIEDIIHYTKILRSHMKVRKFDKDKSVFRDWIPLNEETQKKCLEHDVRYWKISKLIIKTDPQDLDNLLNLIEDNFGLLNCLYVFLISSSDYPGASMVDFTRFIKTCRVLDKDTDNSRLDQLFLNSINEQDQKITSVKVLKRWKFLEFIVRLSYEKYIEKKKIVNTYTEALKLFLKKNILEIWDEIQVPSWQEFRQDFIWTLEINDLLEANLEGLRLIFNKFKSKHGVLKMADAMKIFTNSQVQLSDQLAKFCFGMSKMTVVEEFKTSDSRGYGVMEFTEFLEMICRVGNSKYRGDKFENLDLVQKVIIILDDILPIVGYERQEVNIEAEEISESDEDY